MKSRLRRNNTGMNKTASYYTSLHSISLRSGDYIDFQVKVMANRPWYTIVQESSYDASSYYDGPDFERAFQMYLDIVTAFKGVSAAEQVQKLKSKCEHKADQLMEERNIGKYEDMYQSLKRNPLFLGMNDF